jgi:hypothetical protein
VRFYTGKKNGVLDFPGKLEAVWQGTEYELWS